MAPKAKVSILEQLTNAGFLVPEKLTDYERNTINTRLTQEDVDLLIRIQRRLHQAPADPAVGPVPPRGTFGRDW